MSHGCGFVDREHCTEGWVTCACQGGSEASGEVGVHTGLRRDRGRRPHCGFSFAHGVISYDSEGPTSLPEHVGQKSS